MSQFKPGDVLAVRTAVNYPGLAVVCGVRQSPSGQQELWLVRQGTTPLPGAGEGEGVWVRAAECRLYAAGQKGGAK